MCKNKMGSTDESSGMMLLAVTVLGGAASNMIVTPVVNAIWSKDKDKARSNGAYVKIGLGILGMMYLENEMLQAASLGMLVAGGSEVLQAKVKAFQPGTLRAGTNGVGEVIDLSADDWYEVGAVSSDHAVAGGVY